MQVLKFRGSLLACASSIKKVIQILYEKPKDIYIIFIPSFYGINDKLIHCGQKAAKGKEIYKILLRNIENDYLNIIKELFPITNQSHIISYFKKNINKLEIFYDGIFQVEELSKRSLNKIISFGEINSSYLIAEKLKIIGINVTWKDTRDLIVINNKFGDSQLDFIKTNFQIRQYFQQEKSEYIILPSKFIPITEKKETTTFEYYGSDFIAAIIASSLSASSLEIWTNTSGIMTANLKIVPQAFFIKNISYEEAIELSHSSVQLLAYHMIHPIIKTYIPIQIKNIFSPSKTGTYIHNCKSLNNRNSIIGISSIEDISLLTIKGNIMVNKIDYFNRLFKVLSNEKINVIFITQSSLIYSITIGINRDNILKAKKTIDIEFFKEIEEKYINPTNIEQNLSIISIIGNHMKNFSEVSGKMFTSLSNENINIHSIAQEFNKKNISTIIEKKDFTKALNTLHEIFFEKQIKKIHLFISGVGQVGKKLIEQIKKQQTYLYKYLNLYIKIIGITNSKKMLFEKNGINLNDWEISLQKSQEMNSKDFIEIVHEFNLCNSLFVDNTANQNIAMIYEKFLEKGIGVITCNKIACSSEYAYYKKLKTLSNNFNCPFLFETNVGASLPVISTLNDLINSGDKIYKIEAVLSGSLNFIFNYFKENIPFFKSVKEAANKGYTEPDPRIDLSGIDVMRKILILARECGETLELSDITQKSFLPKSCLNTLSIEDFYKKLEENTDYFFALQQSANKENKHLRFIARYETGQISVGLEKIESGNPFYQIDGKDNMILYFTKRYGEQPLVIKGAGAGAEITASGVFSDIIKSKKY